MNNRSTNRKQINPSFQIKHNPLLYIASASFILILLAFFYNRFLPLWIESVVCITVLVGVILIGFNRLPKSVSIISIVIMLLASFGLFYSQSLLNRAFNQLSKETSIMSFVVLKDSPIESLKEGSSYHYGYSDMLDDDLKDHAFDEVYNEFSFKISPKNYAFDTEGFVALKQKKIDVLIIDNALAALLDNETTEFWKEVKIIHTLSKDFDRNEITTSKNFKKEPFVVYISGLDIEGPLTIQSRSDVNILVFVNPNQGEILQVTIPRDYYVPIACQNDRKDKLTHAGLYGVECSIKTIENHLDIEIDLFARVNFTSFLNIIDVIGEIDVYSKHTFYTSEVTGPVFLVNKGINTFDAQEALSFARARYNLPEGDIDRGRNQQEVIKGVIKKLTSPSQIFNIEKIIKQTARSVDTNATSDQLLALVNRQIRDNIQWNFTSRSMVGIDSMLAGTQNPNQLVYYMQPDPKVENEIKDQIQKIMKP